MHEGAGTSSSSSSTLPCTAAAPPLRPVLPDLERCPLTRAARRRADSPPTSHHVTRRRRLSLDGAARLLAALDLRDKGI